MPRAHVRLEGFAECALDEGRFFATVPRNAEEAERMMKREVLRAWEDRAIEAFGKIEELDPELERRQYELEIAKRLLAKAQDDAARETWQTQVDVLTMLAQRAENDLAEQEEEQALCETMSPKSGRSGRERAGERRQNTTRNPKSGGFLDTLTAFAIKEASAEAQVST